MESLLECVMCLADGDHTPASFMVDLKDFEAAYCGECAQTMQRNGFTITPIRNPQPQDSSNGHHHHTPVTEIVNGLKEGKSTRDVAEETGVSKNTVLSVRREIKEELPTPVMGAPSHKTPMTKLFGAHSPVSQEIKDAILAEPATVSNTELEKKYGPSVSWIGQFRRQHGIVTDGMRRARGGAKYKVYERNIATEALKAGKGKRVAQRLSGLSFGTIDNIFRELGMQPEKVRRLIARAPEPTPADDEGVEVAAEGIDDLYVRTLTLSRRNLLKIQQQIEELRKEEAKLLALIKVVEPLVSEPTV